MGHFAIVGITILVVVIYGNIRLAKIESAKLQLMTQYEREKYLAEKRAAADRKRALSEARSDEWAYGPTVSL